MDEVPMLLPDIAEYTSRLTQFRQTSFKAEERIDDDLVVVVCNCAKECVGVYDVLINGMDAKESVIHSRYGDVLPSNKALAGAGIEMIGRDGRDPKEHRHHRQLNTQIAEGL